MLRMNFLIQSHDWRFGFTGYCSSGCRALVKCNCRSNILSYNQHQPYVFPPVKFSTWSSLRGKYRCLMNSNFGHTNFIFSIKLQRLSIGPPKFSGIDVSFFVPASVFSSTATVVFWFSVRTYWLDGFPPIKFDIRNRLWGGRRWREGFKFRVHQSYNIWHWTQRLSVGPPTFFCDIDLVLASVSWYSGKTVFDRRSSASGIFLGTDSGFRSSSSADVNWSNGTVVLAKIEELSAEVSIFSLAPETCPDLDGLLLWLAHTLRT